MKILWLLLLLSSSLASASYVEFDGFGRVRSVKQKNYDFTDGAKDSFDYTSYRFQLNAKMSLEKNANTHIYMSSRFNKVAGDYTTGNQTSGNLGNETAATMHEAYIAHRFNDALAIKVGRMEVNYGDQLAIGGVGWSDLGRAFDGGALSYTSKLGRTDVFVMTIKELSNIPAGNKYDHDLHGIYHSGSFGKNFKEVDAYLLFDENVPAGVSVQALGLRAKSKVAKDMDYRAEVILEKIKSAGVKNSANMFDVEFGYTLGKFRLALEYSVASEHFNQLYPTAHKWMGYADLFNRSNLEQKAFHVSYKHDEKTSAKLSFHMFDRVKTSNTNFAWNAPVVGATNEKTLGNEIDLTIKHNITKNLALQLGYSMFFVGDYYKNNGLRDNLTWGYAQLLARF